jgi:hypothetical protein
LSAPIRKTGECSVKHEMADLEIPGIDSRPKQRSGTGAATLVGAPPLRSRSFKGQMLRFHSTGSARCSCFDTSARADSPFALRYRRADRNRKILSLTVLDRYSDIPFSQSPKSVTKSPPRITLREPREDSRLVGGQGVETLKPLCPDALPACPVQPVLSPRALPHRLGL